MIDAGRVLQPLDAAAAAIDRLDEYRVPAELADAIESVLDEQAGRIAIQRRFIGDMREIWMMQPRFERRSGRSPWRQVSW